LPDSYFPLDVNFFDHPKVVDRSDGAVRLYLAANGYANRLMTDGYIARSIPGRLVSQSDTGTAVALLVAELVGAVLWHEADVPCPRGHVATCPELPGATGWRIHDFLEHNRSKEKRLEAQKAERDRKAAWREKQRKAQNEAQPDASISGDAGVPRDTTRDSHIPRDAGVTLLKTKTETEKYSPPSLSLPVRDPEGFSETPKNRTQREGKAPRQSRPPRTPRHPSDEFVIQRARQIRAESGPDAAQAYLRTVAGNYEGMSKAEQLRRLEAIIAQDAAAEDGGS